MASHIVLTSHPRPRAGHRQAIHWGAHGARERGPLIASLSRPAHRNVIGTHAGAYSLYRALAVAAGNLQSTHRPDLSNTLPAALIGPHPQWADAGRIVSLDPWGHRVAEDFGHLIAAGLDIRPTIAVTTAHINMPELSAAIASAGKPFHTFSPV